MRNYLCINNGCYRQCNTETRKKYYIHVVVKGVCTSPAHYILLEVDPGVCVWGAISNPCWTCLLSLGVQPLCPAAVFHH